MAKIETASYKVTKKLVIKNAYKVPKKQWSKWSETGKQAFNGIYVLLSPVNQKTFSHPKAEKLPTDQWNTLRWNTAWATASLLTEGLHK